MALIGKIRKNFWFVLILLGLALAAFILMDMTSASNMGGVGNLNMGNINGERIDYREFQVTEQAYYGTAQGDTYEKRNNIWDYFVERALVKGESSDLGLSVSHEELMDLQFGATPSPIITQNWRNPQTGQLDVANLNQFKTAIENNEELNPQFRQFWAEQEKQIIKSQLQNKIVNLTSKAIYTPKWLAENAHKEDNDKVSFKYVKIPFSNIDDSAVSLTDADYKSFLAKNAHTYKNEEETRVMDFVAFNVIPTKEDSLTLQTKANGLKAEFSSAANDSLFCANNNGAVSPFYFNADALPDVAKEGIRALNPGEIYGPYIDQNSFNLIKLLDSRVIPDSVEARHILRSVAAANVNALADANAFMDSIENRYKRGTESFADLATKNSQDPGSAAKGGSLGTFVQGAMVPEFNDVCFVSGKKGGVYRVVTQFGVHLIKIENQKFNNRDPKYKLATAILPIIPSEETQNAGFDRVSDLVSENRDIESLNAAIQNEGVEIVSSGPLTRNDFSIPGISSTQIGRDMVRWAYDESTEVEDVSPEVYTITDNINYYNSQYIIATLKEVVGAGLPTVSSMKSTLQADVLKAKKGEAIASKVNATSLDDVAAQFSTTVQEASDVAFKGLAVPGLGNEQDVISSAFSLPNMSVSKPIVGNGGVYVIQPLGKVEATASGNISLVKNNVSSAAKSEAQFKLIESLKKGAKIEDKRFTFF